MTFHNIYFKFQATCPKFMSYNLSDQYKSKLSDVLPDTTECSIDSKCRKKSCRLHPTSNFLCTNELFLHRRSAAVKVRAFFGTNHSFIFELNKFVVANNELHSSILVNTLSTLPMRLIDF